MITLDQVKTFTQTKAFAVGVTAVVAGAAGYYAAVVQMKGEYEKLMAEETEGLRLYFSSVNNKPEPEELTEKYSDDEPVIEKQDVIDAGNELLEQYREKATDYRRLSEIPQEEESDEPVEKPDPVKELNALNRIFEEEGMNGTEFDMESELQIRDTNHPYIISFEEFLADDFDHETISVTYYEEDDVLADDRDKPIDDIEGNIGSRWVSNFGYGSKDPLIVYVRNENRSLDFEIVLNKGSYESTVLGIQHSHRGLRKFRSDDE